MSLARLGACLNISFLFPVDRTKQATHTLIRAIYTLLASINPSDFKPDRASLQVSNNDHKNVVHVAVEKNLYDFIKRNIDQLNWDDFESRNKWNDTPLMVAQKYGKRRFVELLMRHTDRISLRARYNEGPRHAFANVLS